MTIRLEPDGDGLPDAARIEMRAFAEAFFSRDAGPPDAARLDFFVDDFDDFVANLNPRSRRLVLGCLIPVTRGAPLLVGRPVTLSALPLALRITALERLEKSPGALGLFAIKTLASLCYYEHPDAAAEIGWDGACRGSTP